ncbi:MAG TPA: helix-turn-helix domain-containing protein [Candidatus Nanoarchaeia archaeon]|nr:helix-turn-helix domain-containing protein [Candidatus Nanoarchaeia archaeon]
MVTFACKKIPKEDLIRCSFDLNKTSYKLLIYLLTQKKPLKISDISEGMGLERSSVQKALGKLFEKELVIRSQKNLEKGGYIYFYQTKNKQEIKDRMKKIINNWYENTKKEIERL